DVITYAWDLDGDGQFDDATVPSPQFTYAQPGTYLVSLKVTDLQGASSVATLTITAGNSPPVPTITSPPELTTWNVGDVIAFAGSATDPQQGTLPASALSWS